MITEAGKETIMATIGGKHIFAGDLKYQLQPVIDADMKKKKGKWIYQMTEAGFDNVETLTKNYRNGDDKKLTRILNGIRKMIDMGLPSWRSRDYFKNDFEYKKFQVVENLSSPEWTLDFLLGDPAKTLQAALVVTATNEQGNTYHKEDLIICAEHNECGKYTERFKAIPKYRVKQNTRDYCNGEIVFKKSKGVSAEQRHGFTIHSIQGETAEHKLFIDMTKMKSLQMFYTALSRAKTWKQIYLMMPETG